jgi:hypothetical protein
MRPQRLSRAMGQPSRSTFVHTAAAVFDGETRTSTARSSSIVGGMPKTEHIVGHVCDDLHGAIDIAAKLLGAMACAVDQVVARRRCAPMKLTPAQPNKSALR